MRDRGLAILRLTPGWVRDRAFELREHAGKVESSYQNPLLKAACELVARAYREAAALLDTRAAEIDEAIRAKPEPDPPPSPPPPTRTRTRGAVTRHARERLLDRYGLTFTKQQWRDMAKSIADAIARGEVFEECPDVARSDASDSRWRADVAIVTADKSMQLTIPVGFTYDGSDVTILTVLPQAGGAR